MINEICTLDLGRCIEIGHDKIVECKIYEIEAISEALASEFNTWDVSITYHYQDRNNEELYEEDDSWSVTISFPIRSTDKRYAEKWCKVDEFGKTATIAAENAASAMRHKINRMPESWKRV